MAARAVNIRIHTAPHARNAPRLRRPVGSLLPLGVSLRRFRPPAPPTAPGRSACTPMVSAHVRARSSGPAWLGYSWVLTGTHMYSRVLMWLRRFKRGVPGRPGTPRKPRANSPARHGTAWHGPARHGTARHGMARHGTVYSTRKKTHTHTHTHTHARTQPPIRTPQGIEAWPARTD
jgi:hypothetical protein